MYVLMQFFKRLGIFIFSLLCLNNVLIVFGIFCTLIKCKKANVKKIAKQYAWLFSIRPGQVQDFSGHQQCGDLSCLFIARQCQFRMKEIISVISRIFFSLVIILMKRENGTRTWSIYPIRCDEAWNSSVYGDSFSTVTYG